MSKFLRRYATAKGMGGHQSANAATTTWLTPEWIIREFGPFDIDPCAAPSPRPWPTATRHIELPEDGLRAAWEGLAWVNPPYGSETRAWVEKLSGHPAGGIALIFARTDTAVWQEVVFPWANRVLFLRGRVRFCRPDGGAGRFTGGAPSALVAFGALAASRIEKATTEHGFTITLR